jgi:hypothetical protein
VPPTLPQNMLQLLMTWCIWGGGGVRLCLGTSSTELSGGCLTCWLPGIMLERLLHLWRRWPLLPGKRILRCLNHAAGDPCFRQQLSKHTVSCQHCNLSCQRCTLVRLPLLSWNIRDVIADAAAHHVVTKLCLNDIQSMLNSWLCQLGAGSAPAGLNCFNVSVIWYSVLPKEVYRDELYILSSRGLLLSMT